MSTSEEIAEVYLSDIAEKSNQVMNRKGIVPFLVGNSGKMDIENDTNHGLTVFTLLPPEMQADLMALADATREADAKQAKNDQEQRIKNCQIKFLYKIGVLKPGVKYVFD